jgi:hypothetical protein
MRFPAGTIYRRTGKHDQVLKVPFFILVRVFDFVNHYGRRSVCWAQIEADAAVQEARLRLSRSRAGEMANLGGRLTVVVARACPDMRRSRKSRRQEPLDSPIAFGDQGVDTEHETTAPISDRPV